MSKVALITGVTGQDGSYLASLLLKNDYTVYGTTHTKNPNIWRLSYLGIEQKIKLVTCDLTKQEETDAIIKQVAPDEIYHLAAQSSVKDSLNNPSETITFNINSLLNICESIKNSTPITRLFHASSSEIFSPTAPMPLNTNSPVGSATPYGITKLANHLLVQFYRTQHKLFMVNGILFPHESPLRDSRSFVKSTIIKAVNITKGSSEKIHLGQAENQRDFGYAPKFVEAMWLSLQASQPRDYIISSSKPISIQSITEYILKKTGLPLDSIVIDKALFYTPNTPIIYGDNSDTKSLLNWEYDTDLMTVLDEMIAYELDNYTTPKKNH